MKSNVPRVSAAIIIPSLYLIARTDVPVTMGCLRGDLDIETQRQDGDLYCVCCVAPEDDID